MVTEKDGMHKKDKLSSSISYSHLHLGVNNQSYTAALTESIVYNQHFLTHGQQMQQLSSLHFIPKM
jgi:hypothetical protein